MDRIGKEGIGRRIEQDKRLEGRIEPDEQVRRTEKTGLGGWKDG